MADRRHRKRRQRRRDRLTRRATPRPGLRPSAASLTQRIRRVLRTKPLPQLPRFAPYQNPVRRARTAPKPSILGQPRPQGPQRATRPGTTTSRALVKRLSDCYKRNQRKQVIHALGHSGRGTTRNYRKWGNKCPS